MRFYKAPVVGLAALFSLLSTTLALDLFEALAILPTCGTSCLASTIGDSQCDITNATCICTDNDFYETAQKCILTTCTVLEAIEVAKIEADACQRPVRSRQRDLWLPLIIEIPAWLCPWLRMYSRWMTAGGFAWDDWMMTACGVLYTIFIVIGNYTGPLAFGRDTWDVEVDVVTRALKLFYIDESFYLACLCLTKISILCFYLRIFPNQKFRYTAYVTMAFVIVPTIAIVFLQIFQCRPVSYVWDGWTDNHREDHCLDLNTLTYVAASFSIVQDLIILILPLGLLARLNIGMKSKIGIMIMFSLGIFVLATSCIRLRYLINFGHTANPSWDFTDALIWSGLEVSVSIIVACLPAIRALLIVVLPGLLTTVSGGSYLKEVSTTAASHNKRRSQPSKVFRSKDGLTLNDSEIELGMWDKKRADVQTEISGVDRGAILREDERHSDAGIRIETTTMRRIETDH